MQVAVDAEEPVVSGCAAQPEMGFEPSWKAMVPEGLVAPGVAGVTVAV